MTPTRDERIEEIRGRRYGDFEYKPDRCGAEVYYSTESPDIFFPAQCYRKPGHGLGGLFCKQHAKNNPETGE